MNWTEYYYGFAEHAAKKSKDSTKVGAIIVGPDGEIRMTGFNGIPKGVQDKPERRERPVKYLFSAHAESNTLNFCAREGVATKGCVMYVTHLCCASCARSIIQAGIAEVRYGPGTTSMPQEEFEAAKAMLNEARVTLRPVCL